MRRRWEMTGRSCASEGSTACAPSSNGLLYLEELGVGAILLNPVFSSDTHGYNTRDLREIDCRLGTNEDFANVVDALHARGVRVIVDAVFNHVGRNFWAFRDVRERKWDSPYKDWFHINFDGDTHFGDGFWYEGWEGNQDLVKLNLRNPEVVGYLLDTVRMWKRDLGVDGLRLDVAYSLDRDFVRTLRGLANELGAETRFDGGPGMASHSSARSCTATTIRSSTTRCSTRAPTTSATRGCTPPLTP